MSLSPRLRFWLATALVLAMFGAPLFVGLGRTDLGNDESIYSYAVQSLLETGDWLNPRSSPNPDVVFVEKPPLKFWIVALPIHLGLLPNDEFGLRFWDAAFGAVSFLYVFLLGRRVGGEIGGWVAAMVLFTFAPLLFEHGLRENNMESPLLLAYCGGLFHFLAWSDASSPSRRRGHALAVSAFVFLGFMTKFVAVVFLPMVFAASLLHRPTRRRLREDLRVWMIGGLGIVVLAAPWFLYQMTQPGEGVWRVMLGEHVVTRFRDSLDPSHLQPWYFYPAYIWKTLRDAGTAWIAAAGLLLLALRPPRQASLDALLLTVWLVLPLALISLGTSKLSHYAYPFVPPLAVGAGYLLSMGVRWFRRLTAAGAGTDDIRWPSLRRSSMAWRKTVEAYASRWAGLGRQRGVRIALTTVRLLLLMLAVAWMAMGAVALVKPGRLTVFGVLLQRSPSPPGLFARAVAALLLAGYWRTVLRLSPFVIVLVLAPFPAYRATLPKLAVNSHPLRSVAACMQGVSERERTAGRALRGLLLDLPDGFLHQQFFYLRRFGWEEHNPLPPELFRAALDPKGTVGPVLLHAVSHDRLWTPPLSREVPVPGTLVMRDVLLLLPGPLASCAF